MNSPRNDEQNDFSASSLAERHHRRGAGTAAANTETRNSSARRRGLPNEYDYEREEHDYQARYEQQLQARRQQRASERREGRQKEIVSGRVVKPKSQPKLDENFWRSMKIAGMAIAALMLLVGVVMAYDNLSGSRLFAVKEIDLQGTKRASRDELTSLLATYKTRDLWQLDLQAIRAAVEKNPWVREAEVARVLPNALRVTIQEREPIAPWRTNNNNVVWVDREGQSLGNLDFNQAEQVPPVINGLDESNTEENKLSNQRRMTIYQDLLRNLDQNGNKLSEEIDEVNLRDAQAIKLHLLKRNVTIMIGATDYRLRFEKALKVLAAVEQKDLSALGLLKVSDAEKLVNGNRIAYLNITHPERVIVGFAE